MVMAKEAVGLKVMGLVSPSMVIGLFFRAPMATEELMRLVMLTT